ncbi:MAG: hypothetical protein H7A41_03635 [Chlamydiales bacterium]|nr:hypothetical protein [Chlamydiales bacterium]
MAIKATHGTTQSQGSTQSVKIPGFFERIAIKISALWNGINTKQFDQISNQYSRAHDTLYDERAISPTLYNNYQKYQKMCQEVDQHPTEKLTDLKSQISQIRDEIVSLNRQYSDISDQEEIAYSYIGSGGSGYDGSADRSRISGEIQKLESKLSKLTSDLHAERKAIAQEKGITFFRNQQYAPSYSDQRTHKVYDTVAKGIKAAHKAHPSLTRAEVTVLSMPLFMSDTQQRNLERFLS